MSKKIDSHEEETKACFLWRNLRARTSSNFDKRDHQKSLDSTQRQSTFDNCEDRNNKQRTHKGMHEHKEARKEEDQKIEETRVGGCKCQGCRTGNYIAKVDWNNKAWFHIDKARSIRWEGKSQKSQEAAIISGTTSLFRCSQFIHEENCWKIGIAGWIDTSKRKEEAKLIEGEETKGAIASRFRTSKERITIAN